MGDFKYGGEKFEISSKNQHKLLKWIKPNSRVLELGSASGYITKYLKNNLSCTVTCVELDPEMAKHTIEFSEKTIIGNLDEDNWCREVEGEFDYIILSDVLEHLRNPEHTLSKAMEFLKYEGELLLSIPNVSHSAVVFSLYDGDFNYGKLGLLDDTHIHFFTWKTFNAMLSNLGMKLIEGDPKFKSPGCTELKKFIIKHPLIAIFVILRKDAFTYQFFTRWKRQEIGFKTKRMNRMPNIFQFTKLVLDDFSYFFYSLLFPNKKFKK